MSGKLYWHKYHSPYLLHWVADDADYNRRVDTIKTEKPEDEQEDRLKWFQPVRGALPDELMQAGVACAKAEAACAKADAAYDKARAAHAKARAAYAKAGVAYAKAGVAYAQAGVAYAKARAAYDKARAAHAKADAAYAKAEAAYDKADAACGALYRKYASEIESLHATECPDCSWDETKQKLIFQGRS